MVYDIVNSTPIRIVFIFLSVVLFIGIFLYVYMKKQVRKLNRKGIKHSKKLHRYNDVISWIAFWDVVLAVLTVLFWWRAWSASSMKEKYACSISSESGDSMKIFLKNEGEEKVEESETDKKLHKEWIDNEYKNGRIDQKRIEDYRWRTQNVFSASKEEYIASQEEMQDKKSKIRKNKKNFEDAVRKEQSELTLEKCRNGYCAGKNIINYYHKSENVFQIAVLAENAYGFSVINGTEEKRQEDLANAVKYFEYFTAFNNMDPGDGRIKSKFEIAFRIGKMLYQEVEKLKNGTLSEDKQITSHLSLYAFECFKYAVEGVEKDDENYVLYLYYEGLGAFKLVEYIEETTVKNALYGEVYRQFDAISKEEIDALPKENFENKDKDKFWDVKTLLEESRK